MVEKKLQEITTQLLDFLSNAANKPTYPKFQYFGTQHFEIPTEPNSDNQIGLRLQELFDFNMNPANPKYIGHMDSIPTLWSIIGDYVASAMNNNQLSLEMSPILTQLEYSITRQFATLFGFPNSAGGVMLSGGSLSNLQALIVARNEKLNLNNGNISALQKEPVIFTSEHSHSSIQKIGMILGIGADNVIKIKADENSKMDVVHLEQQVEEQKKLGKIPFSVVATAGTTVSGNIDPLDDINRIAKENNLWFHIDAIYGGAVIFSEKYKHLMNGIDNADSISFNPQKWLYVAKTCSMVLFSDFQNMIENFRISAPYMKEQEDFINLGEINIQGTKYAEIVKLWLSLLGLGKKGIQELIDFSFEMTEKFISEIKKREYLKLVSKPELNLICFRGEPNYIQETEFDEWNKNLQNHLINETDFFISLPRYKDDLWLRTVLLNPFLTEEYIDSLFKEIDIFDEKYKNQT
ncbi:pyridoxal phosphate-dependent decarboxylase family protein [Flagellimonas ruestringensis]|uniref:pyridoxal phosphate-dependent decarboxylase family protein n=1 Tax=Flagellimonas ruestringensis TaxID=111501 RepID=UPI001C9E0C04|nr:aminotransferase class V-fold PLP-dependent enzyme [Allomuricauda ruestringensis]